LQELSKNELDYYKTFALDIVQETMQWLCRCDLRQQAVSMAVNKFGDKAKKIQCQPLTL